VGAEGQEHSERRNREGDVIMEIEKTFVQNSMNQPRAEKIADAMDAAKAEVGAGSEGSAPSKDESPRAQAIREAAQAIDEANAAEEAGDESGEATAKPRGKRAAAPPEETAPEETVGISEVVQERRRLRREHEERGRKLNQSFAAREQQIQSTVQQLMPLAHAAECLQAGDMDGLARALAHFKGDPEIGDWKSLDREIQRLAHVPGYNELRALKARQRQQDELQRRQQMQAQHQAQHQQRAYQEQARAAQEQQWVTGIADELTNDGDSAVADIVGVDPQFAQHVFATQRRHHSESGEIMPPREAAKKVLGALYKNVAGWQEFFAKHAGSAWLKEVMREGGSAGSTRRSAPARGNPSRAANPKQLPAPKQPQRLSAAQESAEKKKRLMAEFAPELGNAMRRLGRE